MSENDYSLRLPSRPIDSPGSGRPREFFIAVAGPDATPYPEEGDAPTVYYCQRLRNVRFTETVGAQTLTYEELEDYKFVFNMEAEKYIEEGSIISAWRQSGQWFTIDKVRQVEMVVCCHGLGATSHSTGTVSRLNPVTGVVLWTYDLGTEATVGRPRVGYHCDLDSRGNVYVAWQASTGADGSDAAGQFSRATGCPAAGIVKLSKNGVLLASHTLPRRNVSFTAGAVQTIGQHARVRVDRSNDDRIYLISDYDDDGYWLYRFDGDLAPVWGAGPAEIHASTVGRGSVLWIADDGMLFVNNTSGTADAYKVNSSGVLVSSGDFSTGTNIGALVTDDSNRPRAGGFRDSIDPILRGADAAFALQWARAISDFSMAPPAGSFDAGSAGQYKVQAAAYGTAGLLFGLSASPPRWAVASPPPTSLHASLLTVDGVSGGVVSAQGWGDWSAGNQSNVLDLAHDLVAEKTYIAGSALASSAQQLAGQLGGWTAGVLTSFPTTLFAWGIAARTVRG